MGRFKIVISSKFKELWRYNIVAVCELCDVNGERLEYKAEESFIASVGSNLEAVPAEYPSNRTISLESGEGDYITLLVYIIPHTLPKTDCVYETKPFALIVKVERDGEQLVNQVFDINQWSGDNIALPKLGATAEKE